MKATLALIALAACSTLCQADIFVSEYSANRIRRFDSAGTDMGTFASISRPLGLRYSPNGAFYVASVSTGRVLELNSKGQTIRTIGAGSPISAPISIAFDSTVLYVSSLATNQILKYSRSNGSYLGALATGGPMDGPHGLAIDSAGNIIVASMNNHSILRYSKSGTLLETYTHAQMDKPFGIATGADGKVYVSSLGANKIFSLDSTLNVIIDDADLAGPNDMLISGSTLYVNSGQEHSVRMYDLRTGLFTANFVGPNGVKEPVGIAVPEPISLVILIIAILSLKNRKQL